jgi:hypothetical protein
MQKENLAPPDSLNEDLSTVTTRRRSEMRKIHYLRTRRILRVTKEILVIILLVIAIYSKF